MSTRARCRPLRVERDDCLWFVTTRTVEERFWLLPLLCANDTERCNRTTRRALKRLEKRSERRLKRLVERVNAQRGPYQAKLDVSVATTLLRDHAGAAIARAQRLYDVRIHAIVVMGNHLHLVVSTPHKNLRKFMGYLKARIADATNFLHGRRGPLWSRRYDAEPILDDEAATDRLVYSVANPPQSDLVDEVEQWPGLCAAFGLRGMTSMQFKYFDRTAWHRARRPRDVTPFIQTATLELSPLPHMEGRTAAEVHRAVSELVEEREARERERRRSEGKQPLGIEGLARIGFEQRPSNPKRSRRPYCHTGCPRRRQEYFDETSAIHEAYAISAERFLAGELDVAFPSGTYPPPLPAAA